MTAQYRKEWMTDRFNEVTVKSWTYARLTDSEKDRIKEALFCFPLHGSTDRHLVEEYESRYYAFLLALGYEPFGWREPEKAVSATD